MNCSVLTPSNRSGRDALAQACSAPRQGPEGPFRSRAIGPCASVLQQAFTKSKPPADLSPKSTCGMVGAIAAMVFHSCVGVALDLGVFGFVKGSCVGLKLTCGLRVFHKKALVTTEASLTSCVGLRYRPTKNQQLSARIQRNSADL
jgi:hypothetical protein